MKPITIYISEKLKLSDIKDDYTTVDNEYYYYSCCDAMVKLAHMNDLSKKELLEIYESYFENFKDIILKNEPNLGLKDFIINYINNHNNCPEMLDETTEEILSYFKDFPVDEFEKYIKSK